LLGGPQASPPRPSDKGGVDVEATSSGLRQGPRDFDFLS
jgi:hypothetical protein